MPAVISWGGCDLVPSLLPHTRSPPSTCPVGRSPDTVPTERGPGVPGHEGLLGRPAQTRLSFTPDPPASPAVRRARGQEQAGRRPAEPRRGAPRFSAGLRGPAGWQVRLQQTKQNTASSPPPGPGLRPQAAAHVHGLSSPTAHTPLPAIRTPRQACPPRGPGVQPSPSVPAGPRLPRALSPVTCHRT